MTFRPEFAPPWVGRSHVTLFTLEMLGTFAGLLWSSYRLPDLRCCWLAVSNHAGGDVSCSSTIEPLESVL
jgi:hypothetical protein